MSDNVEVLVVGAGTIGREYVEICLELGVSPLVVTRGEAKAERLRGRFPSVEVVTGGLTSYLEDNEPPSEAILATPIPTLPNLCRSLVESSVSRVLAEKPLTLTSSGAEELLTVARQHETSVQVAFNRRQYSSVEAARQRISDAGGVSSFFMDFTEAVFRIDPSRYPPNVRRRWGIANSSHVIDTAFHLCGMPARLDAHQTGGAVDWHPAGSIFHGDGETVDGVPFSYHADWGSPGRWRLEVNTAEEKLIFQPMERLKLQKSGTFEIEEHDYDYKLDETYKPGFYRQTERFLEGEVSSFLTLENLPSELEFIENIFGYRRS